MAQIIHSLWDVLRSPVRQDLFTGDPSDLAARMSDYYRSPVSRAYYEKLDAKGAESDWEDMSRRDRFLDVCRSAHQILDFGCGTGHLAYSLAQHFPDAKIWGIDIGDTAEKLAVEKTDQAGMDNLVFRRGNLISSGFADNMFDVVVSRFVVEHVVCPVEMVEEACRILRPGGILYMVYPHLLLTASVRATFRELVSWLRPGISITYLNPDFSCAPCADADAVWLTNDIKLRRILRHAGLTIECNKRAQSLLVARKPL
ncbi:MAG: class I SAM-dependent methyltransferase [Lentisphaerae bacterium]|nr:class I SAM-dependent methyltransferase [Lentisphaerota bacterium]